MMARSSSNSSSHARPNSLRFSTKLPRASAYLCRTSSLVCASRSCTGGGVELCFDHGFERADVLTGIFQFRDLGDGELELECPLGRNDDADVGERIPFGNVGCAGLVRDDERLVLEYFAKYILQPVVDGTHVKLSI